MKEALAKLSILSEECEKERQLLSKLSPKKKYGTNFAEAPRGLSQMDVMIIKAAFRHLEAGINTGIVINLGLIKYAKELICETAEEGEEELEVFEL